MALRIPFRRLVPACAAGFATLLLLCSAALAQSVEGVLRAQGSGHPVAGALVSLESAAGAESGAALSDSAGQYRVAAPVAGTYRLRVQRVGHPDVLSGWMTLAHGGHLEHPLALPDGAVVSLEALRVEAGPRCEGSPRDGRALERAWEEARKALRMTARAAEDPGVEFEFTTFARELAADGRRTLRDSTARGRAVGRAPFASIPADSLARVGYVQFRADVGQLLFHGPDAGVLLSEAFLASHCFRLREGRRGMLGLAFEPVPGARGVDVQGTLWLDRASAELRNVEFSYTGLRSADRGRMGGRLDFARLPSGLWIVRKWSLRWPLSRAELDARTRMLHVGPTYGIREVGGEVTEVRRVPR